MLTNAVTETPRPVRVTGLVALRYGLRFLRDPLDAMRQSHREFGPFAVFTEALPLIRHQRAVLLSVPLILTVGARFNAAVLSEPAAWRSVSLFPGGPRNSAARRLSQGLT